MNDDGPPTVRRAALSGDGPREDADIPPHIRLCMAGSALFTAEMVAGRSGGNVPDTRRALDRLARAGVLVRRSQARGVEFYHRKF